MATFYFRLLASRSSLIGLQPAVLQTKLRFHSLSGQDSSSPASRENFAVTSSARCALPTAILIFRKREAGHRISDRVPFLSVTFIDTVSSPTTSNKMSSRRYLPWPAAWRIKSAIACGWEIIDKCPAFTSIVVAFIRLAMKRSRSGFNVRSCSDTA